MQGAGPGDRGVALHHAWGRALIRGDAFGQPVRHLDQGGDGVVLRHGAPCRRAISQQDQAVCPLFKPNIRTVPAQQRTRAAIHGKADLCRQFRKVGQARQQSPGQALSQIARLPERADQDVAAAFLRGIGVQQAQIAQRLQYRVMVRFGHTADLQVCAVGDLEPRLTIAPRQFTQAQNLSRRQTRKGRAHAHHQPVCGHHRPVGTRAPPLDLRRGHRGTAISDSTELRRVCHRPASSKAANRACIARCASGLASCRNPSVSGSPKVASW